MDARRRDSAVGRKDRLSAAGLAPAPTVTLGGETYGVARLDRRAVEALHDAGALDHVGKTELVDGVLIEMSPAQIPHGRAIIDLALALAPVHAHGLSIVTDVGVFLDNTNMRAPDLSLMRPDAVRGFAGAEHILLAIEIALTTAGYDLGPRARQYAAHGIPDYWVVDPEARRLHVHRAPGPGGYGDIACLDWSVPVSPLCAPDLTVIPADALEGIL